MTAYLPVLKAVLPYIAPLLSASVPMFTKNTEKSSGEQSIQDKQISELQASVKENADSLRILAAQLQQTIAAFDEREIGDQKSFSDLNEMLKTATEENSILEFALEKSIKDIQITKYISLAALLISLLAIAFALFK